MKKIRLVHPSDELTFACPECDRAGDILPRFGTNVHAGNPSDPYYCGKCGATFTGSQIVEREMKQNGKQAKYGDLDLEDVGLSSGVEP